MKSEILTKDLLRELWQELDVLTAAYQTQKICFYKPIGQQPDFHRDDDAAIRLVLGSNRSGKSVAGVMEVIAHALGYRPWLPVGSPNRIVYLANGQPIPVPNVGRIIAQDYQQAIKQTIVPKVVEWAPLGWYTFKRDNRGIPVEINWKNGSTTYLLSNDQKDMSFEGTNGHYVWADEPIDQSKYTGLRRGLMDFSGHMWMTMTPISQPWIHDVIYSRANEPDADGYTPVRCYKFSIWDNCIENGGHIRRKDIEEFLSDLDEAELEARLHGNFMHLAGRVFKAWEPAPPFWVDPYDIPPSWPRICVIDPHPRKPIAVLWAAVDPHDRVIVYRDLFDPRLVTVQDVADKIKELEGWVWDDKLKKWLRGAHAEAIASRLIDDSSKTHERTSGDSVHTRFATLGIHCTMATKGNIDAGIDAIKEALRMRTDWAQPGMVVFNTCRHVKHNFMRFVWEDWATSKQRESKDSKQEAKKKDDDMIACLRYIYQAKQDNYSMLRGFVRRQRDYEEPYNGRGMISGQQGPMTRRERQALNGRRTQSTARY